MLNKLIKNKEEIPTINPCVNIFEQNNSIGLAVEMPGVDKSTLEIHLENNQLIVKGRTKQEDIGKEFKPLYQERRTVEYERRFEINTDIDQEKIDAEYKDGLLKISLKRSQAALPKKIEIKNT